MFNQHVLLDTVPHYKVLNRSYNYLNPTSLEKWAVYSWQVFKQRCGKSETTLQWCNVTDLLQAKLSCPSQYCTLLLTKDYMYMYVICCIRDQAKLNITTIKLFTGDLYLLERYPFPSWCLSQSSTLCLRLSSSDWRFKQSTINYFTVY